MQKTSIQYADYVTNPFRVVDNENGKSGWACIKFNHGCDHCWAEGINKRFGTRRPYTAEDLQRMDPYIQEREMNAILNFKPKDVKHNIPYIFACDMTDFLLPIWNKFRSRLITSMGYRRDIRWLLLTKRYDRLPILLQEDYVPSSNIYIGLTLSYEDDYTLQAIGKLHDVYLGGYSTWISHEPALGPVDWPDWMDFISLMVAGGETGLGWRNDWVEWYIQDLNFCISHGVPFFFKQWAGTSDPLLAGSVWHQMPDSVIANIPLEGVSQPVTLVRSAEL